MLSPFMARNRKGVKQMQPNDMTRTQHTTTSHELLSTTNYDLFKTIIGNRDIYEPHLQRLIASINQNNMLEQNPIIVNEEMRVIDGQHRLLAAKALGVPIYYTIKPHANLAEVQMLNATSKTWSTYDYMNSYITKGVKSYIELKEFADEYRISVPIAMRILADTFEEHNLMANFRAGKFEIVDRQKAENLASLVSEVRKHTPDGAWTHQACVKALATLIEKVKPQLFVSALDRYQSVITRRVSRKDYLREFENILKAGGNNKDIELV
jgi:hypothetical protein